MTPAVAWGRLGSHVVATKSARGACCGGGVSIVRSFGSRNYPPSCSKISRTEARGYSSTHMHSSINVRGSGAGAFCMCDYVW